MRLEQLEGRSLGANSLVTSLQQQLQQLQQQQQQASSTVKSVAEAAQLAQKALRAEAAAQKPPATDDAANAELRARLECLESSAKRTQTVASQQAADMKSRGVLKVPSWWCHSSLPWLPRADLSRLLAALRTGAEPLSRPGPKGRLLRCGREARPKSPFFGVQHSGRG